MSQNPKLYKLISAGTLVDVITHKNVKQKALSFLCDIYMHFASMRATKYVRRSNRNLLFQRLP